MIKKAYKFKVVFEVSADTQEDFDYWLAEALNVDEWYQGVELIDYNIVYQKNKDCDVNG